jgi:hypothetical protein
MKKAEIIIAILCIVAIVMNLLLVPGATIITVLSLSMFSCFYMYFSFALFNGIRLRNITKKESYKDISKPRIIGAVGAGLALALTIIGIMCILQSYPGASFNLGEGLVALSIVSVVGLARYIKTRSSYYIGISKRIVIIGMLGLTLFYLPRTTIIDFKYRNHPGFRDAVKNVIANPGNEELQRKLEEERVKMHQDE